MENLADNLPQLNTDSFSIFGQNIQKRYMYIAVAVLVLLVAFYLYRRYMNRDDVEEDVEEDDEHVEDNIEQEEDEE